MLESGPSVPIAFKAQSAATVRSSTSAASAPFKSSFFPAFPELLPHDSKVRYRLGLAGSPQDYLPQLPAADTALT